MFKKLILVGIIAMNLSGCQGHKKEYTVDGKTVKEYIASVPYNGDFDFNQYKITEVNGDEINGIAINHKSNNNMGIVLSKKIDKVNVKPGDKILVVFEKDTADSIMEVKKME